MQGLKIGYYPYPFTVLGLHITCPRKTYPEKTYLEMHLKSFGFLLDMVRDLPHELESSS